MSAVLTSNTQIGSSLLPEAPFNTMYELLADFEGEGTQSFDFTPPNLEKIVNEGLIGDGEEWATQTDNDYWSQPAIRISDRVNGKLFGKHLRRHLNGDVTDTAVAGSVGAYDHVIQQAAPDTDPQVLGSTYLVKWGGLRFVLGGMSSNSLSISHDGAAQPNYVDELIGTGNHTFMDLLAVPIADVPKFVIQQNYMKGNAVSVSWNNGSLQDMTASARYRSFSFQSSNALQSERVSGDPTLPVDIYPDVDAEDTGAYIRAITRGGVRPLTLQVGVLVHRTERLEFENHAQNKVLTDFRILMRGRKVGATVALHEAELIVPKTVIQVVGAQDRADKSLITLGFTPLKDAAQVGLWYARIRNGTATLN